MLQLDTAQTQTKKILEENNKNLNTDMERWHFTKRADLKELLGGLADRNIHMYDEVSFGVGL